MLIIWENLEVMFLDTFIGYRLLFLQNEHSFVPSQTGNSPTTADNRW